MVDSCVITRPGAQGALNETTLQYEGKTYSLVYAGPCRVRPRDNADRVVDAGDQPMTLLPYLVAIPVSAPRVQIDDRVQLTTCQLDPQLVDAKLRVRDVARGSHVTARRLGCEVNEG